MASDLQTLGSHPGPPVPEARVLQAMPPVFRAHIFHLSPAFDMRGKQGQAY